MIARDERGIALGGIRLPDIDVPVALNTGVGMGPSFCGLYGSHQPFDAATLNQLYPEHGACVRAVWDAANQSLDAGFIEADAARDFSWRALGDAERFSAGDSPTARVSW